MSSKYYIVFIIAFVLTSCHQNKKYIPKNLVKLTESELLERAKQKKLINFEIAVYKNDKGETLSKETADSIFNKGGWTFDRYADAKGVIRELLIRKETEKDREFFKKLLAAYQHKPPVETIDVDCSDLVNILNKVYKLDQKGRVANDEKYDQYDAQNLITVVSIIEKCGMPTLKEVNEKQMETIWLVFQHSEQVHRKKYFNLLKKSAENGAIKKDLIAKMQDRILVLDGEPQIYGTQVFENAVTKKMELYQLKDPEFVDEKRRKVGLGPLKDYLLKHFDIVFDVQQKSNKN